MKNALILTGLLMVLSTSIISELKADEKLANRLSSALRQLVERQSIEFKEIEQICMIEFGRVGVDSSTSRQIVRYLQLLDEAVKNKVERVYEDVVANEDRQALRLCALIDDLNAISSQETVALPSGVSIGENGELRIRGEKSDVSSLVENRFLVHFRSNQAGATVEYKFRGVSGDVYKPTNCQQVMKAGKYEFRFTSGGKTETVAEEIKKDYQIVRPPNL